jgi:hypothetical protein
MPTYCYEDAAGVVHERDFSIMAQIPPEITLDDGRKARRCYHAERKGAPALKGWPMTCVASGVNASQAGELRDLLARKGVPTEVTRDGDPVYRSASHRRQALKARGFIDRSSYV